MPQDVLMRGTRLDRYEIRVLLGQGGMGQVYRAWDTVLQRDVALKLLGAPDEELLVRFAREAEAISQLNHLNVVAVHDFNADALQPYLVMEYLRGEDLSRRLRRGSMPVAEAVEAVLGVCAAVHACHAVGIIHRDLKPGNVFLHETVEFGNVVKVLDFGVAMLRRRMPEEITQPGHVVGTPRYLSPEQARHTEADAQSDQYAIGHLLYTALAGRSPFAKKQGPALIKAIMKAEYPPLRELRPEVSEGLAGVVDKAMSVDKARRYPSVLAFSEALQEQGKHARGLADSAMASARTRPEARDNEASTEVGLPLALLVAEQHARISVAREARAAALDTLEGDDSRPALGPVVVPIGPFQEPPSVSTTAHLPTATAIDPGTSAAGRPVMAPVRTASRREARQRHRLERDRGGSWLGNWKARLVLAAIVITVLVGAVVGALGQ